MNVEKVISRISLAGLLCRRVYSEAGPAIQVKVPYSNRAICGLVPIDDESDDRFADYLIAETRKEEEKNEKVNDL